MSPDVIKAEIAPDVIKPETSGRSPLVIKLVIAPLVMKPLIITSRHRERYIPTRDKP